MMDATRTEEGLPTPGQLRNYFAALDSAKQARRMREASRAILTGNVAAAVCLVESVLVIQHAGWTRAADGSGDTGRMMLLNLVIYGFLACAVGSLWWQKRQRSRSPVYVLGRLEAEQDARSKSVPESSRKLRVGMLVVGWFLIQGLGVAFWSIAFRGMSNAAILGALSVGPLIATVYFVVRFMLFQFWEDLAFATAIALAWLPFLFQAWHLAYVCLIAMSLVILATACLYLRWVRWRDFACRLEKPALDEEFLG